jgi:hypothetical protein
VILVDGLVLIKRQCGMTLPKRGKMLDIELWDRLVEEKNFELIDRLHKIENRVPGYTSIVITQNGFSTNDETHNMVIQWLKRHRYVNLVNPRKIVYELVNSQTWR